MGYNDVVFREQDIVLCVYKLVEDNGFCPVDTWLESIRDKGTRARVMRQVDKMERGNFGDHKFFDGIGELRLDFGPGHRVYFGRHGNVVVLLLGGGDKSGQQADIVTAKRRFAEWKKRGSLFDSLPSWSEPLEYFEQQEQLDQAETGITEDSDVAETERKGPYESSADR